MHLWLKYSLKGLKCNNYDVKSCRLVQMFSDLLMCFEGLSGKRLEFCFPESRVITRGVRTTDTADPCCSQRSTQSFTLIDIS